ncbi:MAG: aminodeoxychorismate/anthranilate synthase component II [Bacteroidales bacterium]|nr:aminodeoxychorismate/anthranilate synthase component II [Bacteroidales bacterium]
MKKVLLIDNYDSFTYNLAQLLDESTMCNFQIIKNDIVKIGEISEFDKILISPGPGLPENAGKLPEIIAKYHKTKSILGICLGMQGIAEFFGAELYNLEKVYHGIKANAHIIDSDEVIFTGLPERIEVGLYHSWAVYKDLKDTDLKITAISQRNIIMGISHKEYDIKGIQFHPESIMTKYGQNIIENWLSC